MAPAAIDCHLATLLTLTLAAGVGCHGAVGSADDTDAGGGGAAPDGAAPADAASEAVAADPCPESPAPRQPIGTIVEIPLGLSLNGNVVHFGEPNPAAAGATITPLNVRFYLSNVALTKSGGAAVVPVDIVTAAGAAAPYGVHFFNGEDPATQVLRIRAPAGSYDGMQFSFGLADACNAGLPERNPPLSAASQMTWPHGFGYLFFRYEARVDGGSDAGDGGATAPIPAAIHMGGFPHLVMAPGLRAGGTMTVPATGAAHTLFLAMDEVFRGARMSAQSQLPLQPPGAEAALGENLRQAAPQLTLFVLAP